MTRKTSLANLAKSRDKKCCRCNVGKSLVAHHIVALADGGTDCLCNLITLCSVCHDDWHHVCEGQIEFNIFLKTPSSRSLLLKELKIQISDINSNISNRTKIGLKKALEKGATLGRPKSLTEEQERDIVRRKLKGASFGFLAKNFNVSRSAIQRVMKRYKNA